MNCGADDSCADVILRITKANMDLIVRGKKNHEYRKYELEADVQTIWLYVDETEAIQ